MTSYLKINQDRLLASLVNELNKLSGLEKISKVDLIPIRSTGLAHEHIRINGFKLLARVPKQSQLGLGALENLSYQEACFKRTSPSNHTPKLYKTLAPTIDMPMGALIVEEIIGESLCLPQDALPMCQALASIHSIPLPSDIEKQPLKNPLNALTDTFKEILDQSAYINNAQLAYDSEHQIREELVKTGQLLTKDKKPATSLIAFDSHPGNFLRTRKNKAILVDLEKARYGVPAFDLAHATLYTSTTWDIDTFSILNHSHIAKFYEFWLENVPKNLSESVRDWLVDLRRMMWLWSITWCVKWQVQIKEKKSKDNPKIDSTNHYLINHVADRVGHYLKPEVIEKVRKDWSTKNDLTTLLDYKIN